MAVFVRGSGRTGYLSEAGCCGNYSPIARAPPRVEGRCQSASSASLAGFSSRPRVQASRIACGSAGWRGSPRAARRRAGTRYTGRGSSGAAAPAARRSPCWTTNARLVTMALLTTSRNGRLVAGLERHTAIPAQRRVRGTEGLQADAIIARRRIPPALQEDTGIPAGHLHGRPRSTKLRFCSARASGRSR